MRRAGRLDPASGYDVVRARPESVASIVPTRRRSAPDSAIASACSRRVVCRLHSPARLSGDCDQAAHTSCNGAQAGGAPRRRRRQAVERPFVAVAPRAEHLADVVSHAAFLSAVVAVQAGPDGGCRLVLCSRRKPTATLRPRGTWLRELIVFEAGRPVCIVVHTRFGVIGGVWAAKSSEPATSSGMIERFAEAVHWLPFLFSSPNGDCNVPSSLMSSGMS